MVQTQIPHPNDEVASAESPVRAHAREKEEDPLIELELRVARRADELARTTTTHTSLNLRHWLQAEQEILQPLFERFAPQSQASAGAMPWRTVTQN